jgi:hypothetical protein
MPLDILPDSRANNVTVGSKMVDWPMPGGKTVRIEVVLVYCANCGEPHGYVPKENTTFAFYMCQQCFEKYGNVPGTWAMPDDEFNQNVAHEIEERYGHELTEEELYREVCNGTLGPVLEALVKDSPYPAP